MKSSTRDEAVGKMHQAKGKVKEVVGKALNKPGLEAEGEIENISGKAQEKVGDVKRAVGK